MLGSIVGSPLFRESILSPHPFLVDECHQQFSRVWEFLVFLKNWSLGFRVWGLGFRGLRFRVWGLGFKGPSITHLHAQRAP